MQTEPISKITNEKKDKALMLSWDLAQVAVFQNAQILHYSNVSNLKICIFVPFFNRVWEKMKPIFTPNAPCHLLVWVKATRSILFQILHWNHAPTRKFAEEIHDCMEFC